MKDKEKNKNEFLTKEGKIKKAKIQWIVIEPKEKPKKKGHNS